MKRFLVVTALVGLTGALAVAPASAKNKCDKVKGHVIKVEQHVRTENGGEFDRLIVRTRNGENMQLNLGQGGACEGCFQAGDMIRARVNAADGSGAAQMVQSARVRRNGEMAGFTNTDGKLRQTSGFGRHSGGNERMGSRKHDPGSGACPGCNSGRRGGGRSTGGNGGGGGRGGGGG